MTSSYVRTSLSVYGSLKYRLLPFRTVRCVERSHLLLTHTLLYCTVLYVLPSPFIISITQNNGGFRGRDDSRQLNGNCHSDYTCGYLTQGCKVGKCIRGNCQAVGEDCSIYGKGCFKGVCEDGKCKLRDTCPDTNTFCQTDFCDASLPPYYPQCNKKKIDHCPCFECAKCQPTCTRKPSDTPGFDVITVDTTKCHDSLE